MHAWHNISMCRQVRAHGSKVLNSVHAADGGLLGTHAAHAAAEVGRHNHR